MLSGSVQTDSTRNCRGKQGRQLGPFWNQEPHDMIGEKPDND